MIEELTISGLGVIDRAQLAFSPRLTVLTGETGAGKTMVLTSLRLLLGDKGDTELVREGHPQIAIDGVISPTNVLLQKFAEMGIVEEDEVIISRTVPQNGRSKAIINGRPVPLRTLADIVSGIVTIHGQADQWRVRKSQVQQEMLDIFCGPKHGELLAKYSAAWNQAVQAKKQLDQLHSSYDQHQIEVQYLQEVTGAITELNLRDDEERLLEQEIERLANAADLREDIGQASMSLVGTNDDDLRASKTILDQMSLVIQGLRRAGKYDEGVASLAARVESIQAEVEQIGQELAEYLDLLADDPAELNLLYQRRAQLDDLMKGRATSFKELSQWHAQAVARLAELTADQANPQLAQVALEEAQEQVIQLGQQLSASREQGAKRLAAYVNDELQQLAMPTAHFRVILTEQKPSSRGLEEVSMEMRAHPDAPFRPLGEGASGGELSRIMLALEVALGETQQPGTYIFDEVDAGIGGRTATEIGRRLARLSANQQVVVVTHLPQVAAFADRHLVVRKDSGKTVVEEVNGESRVEEIVRMLGGTDGSLAARRHALELLANISWQNH